VVHVIAVATAALGAVVAVALGRAAWRTPSVAHARRLRPYARWPLPPVLRVRLGRALARADLDVAPEDALRVWLVAVLVAAMLAGAMSPAAAVGVALLALAAGPLALWWARGRADERVAGALPAALDRVAAGLRAGSTVRDGLADLAAANGPLAPDLRRVDARCRLGVTLTEALEQWSHERPVPAVGALGGAFALAVTVGGASAGALEGLGESLRTRDAAVREARALSAQARLSAWVVGAAPVAYLGFVTLTDPGAVDALVSTGAGRACLVVGLVLEALAALWMRALLQGTA
jgi:tight adherence protein B